jgi:hypothetical protein
MTMAIVCRGVMPRALNTPRSCTRSRGNQLKAAVTRLSPAKLAMTLSPAATGMDAVIELGRARRRSLGRAADGPA